ncbi:MAG TPA: hypothetical protein VGQ31_09240 [Candidatus Limnocylindrales bacterium]|jgi:hypothetical protein|nr:hypothetical protein [Candidatus Limnocylindrales bacterium]
MHAFLVELDNKAGELARITEAIAAKGVDLRAVSGSTCGSSGSLALMTDDEAETRQILTDTGATFRELEVTEASVGQAPGSLATIARRLADAGVNIEAVMPIGMVGNEISMAFITNDPATARTVLGRAGSATG